MPGTERTAIAPRHTQSRAASASVDPQRTPSLGALAIVSLVVAATALSLSAYPLGAKALLVAFVSAVLVVLAAIDLERRIVPNRIVLPAAGATLIGRIALAPGDMWQYLLAALLAALFLFLPRLFKADAMGMGDVKLGLLIGAALGWGTASALALGFLFVFPAALVITMRGGVAAARKATLPMCPFLASGALIVLLGPGLVGS